jgi:hypothetical protein
VHRTLLRRGSQCVITGAVTGAIKVPAVSGEPAICLALQQATLLRHNAAASACTAVHGTRMTEAYQQRSSATSCRLSLACASSKAQCCLLRGHPSANHRCRASGALLALTVLQLHRASNHRTVLHEWCNNAEGRTCLAHLQSACALQLGNARRIVTAGKMIACKCANCNTS